MKGPELGYSTSWKSFEVHARKNLSKKANVMNGWVRAILMRAWKEKRIELTPETESARTLILDFPTSRTKVY